MIISHKHKFIFFANPKTGTVTVESVLKDFDEIETIAPRLEELNTSNQFLFLASQNFRHILPRYVKQVVSEDIWNNYFKFVFVRNPWDWALSQYCHNFCKPGTKYQIGLFLHKFFLQPHPNIDLRKDKFFTKRDFYLNWIDQKRRRFVKQDENSFQYHFVQDSNGEKMVDFIGKYENLKNDFDYICRVVGLGKRELPLFNQSKGKSLHYRDYYREDTKSLVAEKYRKDIEILGYDF